MMLKHSLATIVFCIGWASLAPPTPVRADQADQADANDPSEPATLSVAPLNHAEYPKDRPKWVQQEPELADDTGMLVVTSGISDSPEKAAETLTVMQRAAVETVFRYRLEKDWFSLEIDSVPLNDDWIENALVVRRYDGQVSVGGETKYESAVMLDFSDEANAALDAVVRECQMGGRLGLLGMAAGGSLAIFLSGSIVLGGLANRQARRGTPKV